MGGAALLQAGGASNALVARRQAQTRQLVEGGEPVALAKVTPAIGRITLLFQRKFVTPKYSKSFLSKITCPRCCLYWLPIHCMCTWALMIRRRIRQSRCLFPHRATAMRLPPLCHKAGGPVGAQAARAAARRNLAVCGTRPAATLGRRLAFLPYLLLNLAGRAALRVTLAALLHPASRAPGCTALRSIARA